MGALILHSICKPFFDRLLNNAEKWSLFTLAFVIYTTTSFATRKPIYTNLVLYHIFEDERSRKINLFLEILDLLVGLGFLLYYLHIVFLLARKKLIHLRERIRRFLRQQNPQPTLLQKTLRRLATRFVGVPQDQNHVQIQSTQTEADLISSGPTKLQVNTTHHNDEQMNDVDYPHTLQYIDTDVKNKRNNHHRSNSFHHNKVSTNNTDVCSIPFRQFDCGSNNDIFRIGTRRSLRSQTNPLIFTRNTSKTRLISTGTLSSQAYDTEAQGFFGSYTLTAADLDEGCRHNILMNDPTTATFKKATLEDPRFRDISKVQINEEVNNNLKEQEADSRTQDNESESHEKALSLDDVLQENGIEPISGRSTSRAQIVSIDDIYKEKNEDYNEGEPYGEDNVDQRKL